jgi:integrase
MKWWWNRHGQRLRAPTNRGFLEKHLRAKLGPVPLHQITAETFDALLTSKKRELAPKSLNHLRAVVHRMFKLAAAPGVGLWSGANPIADEPSRKVPRRLPLLRWNEMPRVRAELASTYRWIVAVAVYTGMRNGEILGLHREDVDLASGTFRIWRSWDAKTTKDGKPALLPIAPGLRRHIAKCAPGRSAASGPTSSPPKRCLRRTAAPSAPSVADFRAPVVHGAPSGKEEGRVPSVSREESRPSKSGRQDLNLRPLGPEPSALPG